MAVTSKYSDTEASSLMDLLNGSERFIVPQFQRNYAWTKDMASELWHDLTDSFQSIRYKRTETQEGQYLLGPIVLVPTKDNGVYSIIDGQQRLSTITMLFCVARDIMLENMDRDSTKPEGYDKIMEMIENKNLRNEHVNWKMVLNDADKCLFEEIQAYEDNAAPQIERINKITPKTKSEKLLVENYKQLYALMLNAICTNFNKLHEDSTKMSADQKKKLIKQNISTLNHFLNHVKKNNFVVKIVVKTSETAYQIFETLNNRSQPLSKSNLIKNYVLSQVKNTDEQRDMSNHWNRIFEDIGQDVGDDVFLLDSYRSRKYDKKISPKHLYRIIKKDITGKLAKRYIKELRIDADFLTTLYNPSEYPDESIKSTVYAIRQLDAKIIRPPILAAYRRWYDEQKSTYEQLVLALLKFFFNVRIIRKMHAGKLEKIMSDAVKIIVEGESLQSVIIELQKHNDPNDFKHNFNNFMNDPRPNEAKYVLQQITMALGSKHSDVKPLDTLTLEHILPQNPNKWNMREFLDNQESDTDINKYINHLGNLTLLNTAINKKIRNAVFSIKKTEYMNSDLAINKQTVCNYEKWTAKVIEERAKMFADVAYELWDLDNLRTA